MSALPFPHAIIESLFPEKSLRALAAEIPETMLASGCVPGAAACYRKRGVHYRKSELHDAAQGPYTRALFATLRTRSFVQFLERLSGVHRLIPDPGFQGSGVHLTGPGGILKVHHDFNFMRCKRTESADGDYVWDHGGGSGGRVSYSDCRRGASAPSETMGDGSSAGDAGYSRLHRRVNVFVYINDDWPESYNGHLELWSRNMTTCVRRIAPTFGRFVVFSSTDFSFHGHPAPMPLPPGRMRRSLAFYYYTEGDRPVAECEAGDCASFHDARWQDPVGCAHCRACAST